MTTRRIFFSAVFMVLATDIAMGQASTSSKAINTGGEKGAYHSLFCPPIPEALTKAYFQGYSCVTSGGTLDNISRVLNNPTQMGFVQLDVFSKEMAARPDDAKKLAVIRQDLACEGLWMVTKNDSLKNFGDVMGLARRIPFVLPPKESGAAASFQYLQSFDPQGLGRVPEGNIAYESNAGAMLDRVASSKDGAVGFFVQFADPENGMIVKMQELGLQIIPVVSREILRVKLNDQPLYQVQEFALKSAGVFAKGQSIATACTPVAIITGAPEGFPAGNAQDDQRELIKQVRDIPAANLLPKEGRLASLIKSAKRLTSSAADEIAGAVESAKQKASSANK